MRIAITGAGGKTGQAVAGAVRAAGHRPIPIVRRPYGLPSERVAAFDDDLALGAALHDVDAVYLIAPNVHADEPGLLRGALAACERARVAVVYHSVMHPHASAMLHHMAKAQVEQHLHNSSLQWTILQPASYMDNVLGPVAAARDGFWRQPYSISTRFTPVALDDVGAAAAAALTDPSYAYGTYELAGPHQLSTHDMAGVIRDVAEMPLEAICDRALWRDGAARALDDAARHRLWLMFDAYDRYDFVGNSHVLAMMLGRPPTTFNEWVLRNRAELIGG